MGVIGVNGSGPILWLNGRLNSYKYIRYTRKIFVIIILIIIIKPIFKHDNAPVHTVGNLKNFKNKIKFIYWNAKLNTQTLSSRENVEQIIKQNFRKHKISNSRVMAQI